MSHFDYLIEKVRNADFATDPFRHIYIENFLTDEDFREIIASPDIAAPEVSNDDELFETLQERGYKVIQFPGCITDQAEYKKWRRGASRHSVHDTIEGFGMTLRLYEAQSELVKELQAFVTGPAFNRVIAEKFDIPFDGCVTDGGIQKYLDGYEISPHPDIRRKATTFMVNINPNAESETSNHHTHYMRFKPEREYVKGFWEGNGDIDRCWVPWDWCESIYQQTKNNSIVIFAPSNDTLHAVRASYDHLKTQRTQLYGNLWHASTPPMDSSRKWTDLDLRRPAGGVSGLKSRIPAPVKAKLRAVLGRMPGSDVGERNV